MNIAEIDMIDFISSVRREMGASESKSLGSLCSSSCSWETGSNNGGNAVLTVEERKKKKNQEVKDALKVAAAVAGVAVVGWGLYRLFSSSSSSSIDERKLMKAPGRKGSHIFRDAFEHDPSSYFKTLRNKDFNDFFH